MDLIEQPPNYSRVDRYRRVACAPRMYDRGRREMETGVGGFSLSTDRGSSTRRVLTYDT